jgi:hypothetical protein
VLLLLQAEAAAEEREASEDELWVHIGRLMGKSATVCKQRIHSLLKGQHLEPAVQILIDHLNRRDAAPLTYLHLHLTPKRKRKRKRKPFVLLCEKTVGHAAAGDGGGGGAAVPHRGPVQIGSPPARGPHHLRRRGHVQGVYMHT